MAASKHLKALTRQPRSPALKLFPPLLHVQKSAAAEQAECSRSHSPAAGGEPRARLTEEAELVSAYRNKPGFTSSS